jgi:signal transduction histidine kinase
MLSLRARVLIGASLWTIGLLLLSFGFIAWVWRNFPDMPLLGRRGSIHFIWASHAGLIFLMAAIAMVFGAFQVRRGLAGITQLRERLAAVRDGRDIRVAGRYVPEVQPLVDDLNGLLEHREQTVRRALSKAADLAHGLKTPLSVLAGEAERAAAAGHADLASSIGQQVDRMRRQLEYHLAHARAAASGATQWTNCAIRESADGLARALARLHANRPLRIDVRVPSAHLVGVQREDLDQMLGNLLDNACKWGRGRVVIDAHEADDTVRITVEDDGPGIEASMRTAVLQRGVRADEQAPGYGLGLAIVRDLSELYQGSIALDESSLGGLRVTLTLPGGRTRQAHSR